jgi:uncharacterized protein (TIGR00730 family)
MEGGSFRPAARVTAYRPACVRIAAAPAEQEAAMPAPIRAVAVFCGSRTGHDPAHAAAARALGAGLARQGMAVVYGGGGIGLMGLVADAALAEGGAVTGVIPEFLQKIERPYPKQATLEVVPGMHVRKARMFELADAFVALSGGLGTLDELVEILTWRQLGLHAKPVLVLDIAGWAQSFIALVDALVASGFAGPESRAMFKVVPDVSAALATLAGTEAGARGDSARL